MRHFDVRFWAWLDDRLHALERIGFLYPLFNTQWRYNFCQWSQLRHADVFPDDWMPE